MAELIEASLSRMSWSGFLRRVQDSPWTLVHGDFHSANVLYRGAHEKPLLLDFEMVGLGSGAQDLGQYFISHLAPSARRLLEKSMLDKYYAVLTAFIGENGYSYDACYREYVYGGVEKWIFLLLALSATIPDKMMQYFHDQVQSFAMDHSVTAESISMPRVL